VRLNGKSSECWTLWAANRRRYQKRNARHLRYKFKYKLSLQEVQDLAAAQDHTCPICGKRAKLVVDHDHATRQVRGLICGLCNSALGFLGDSPDTARAAAAYLERGRAELDEAS
jgi:hypothetical protein